MSPHGPHGPVIWLLALATWAVVLIPLWLWRRRRARVHLITDAQPPAPRPGLDGYTDDAPASGSAWAVGPAPEDPEGR